VISTALYTLLLLLHTSTAPSSYASADEVFAKCCRAKGLDPSAPCEYGLLLTLDGAPPLDSITRGVQENTLFEGDERKTNAYLDCARGGWGGAITDCCDKALRWVNWMGMNGWANYEYG